MELKHNRIHKLVSVQTVPKSYKNNFSLNFNDLQK